MDKYTVLIVEDDLDLAQLTADFLAQHEFQCTIEPNAKIACDQIVTGSYDLVFLDLMLPEMDGFEVCRKVRSQYRGKIIMLTARTDVIDQVVGLEIGADDYIPKPVEPRLLLAKARAYLRQVSSKEDEAMQELTTLSYNSLSLDRARRKLEVGEQSVHLGDLEFRLLELFFSNPGKVVSRDDIFQHIRGIEYDGVNRQVDLLISRLRAKIEIDPKSPELIKTIRNRGYILTCPLS